MTLAYTRITPAAGDPDRWLFLIHGIYGTGRNWGSLARRLVDRAEGWGVILVDLRLHGDSLGFPGPHTVRACAEDLRELEKSLGLRPSAIIGHSFGGKVGLLRVAADPEGIEQLWVADSTLQVQPPAGSAWRVLDLVRGLPEDFGSREELADAAVQNGYDRGMGQWLAMNLERQGDRFRWRLDWAGMEELDGVTLSVPPGSAIGIVGLNGAGKSTLIRVLLGYARPSAGTVTIAGVAPRAYVERYGIAYVPERASIPRGWSVRHAMGTFAMLGDVAGDPWERVDRVIDRLGLGQLRGRRIGALSKGNLQRVAIAQAILGERKLMVLDEPTDGLDPVWIAELRTILAEWRAADPERVIIIASHTLPEIEKISDRVYILHNGRIEGELTPLAAGSTLEQTFLARIAELPEARS